MLSRVESHCRYLRCDDQVQGPGHGVLDTQLVPARHVRVIPGHEEAGACHDGISLSVGVLEDGVMPGQVSVMLSAGAGRTTEPLVRQLDEGVEYLPP